MKKQVFSPYVLATSAATLIAGVLHFTYVAILHKDIPLEMTFFIAIGLAQIIWAVWFYKTKNIKTAYLIGLLINGSVTVVWLLSRLYEAPFGGEVEAFEALDVVIGVLQIVAIVLSAYCVVTLSKAKERSRHIAMALIVPIVGGLLLFTGGRVTALVFNLDTSEHGHENSSVIDADHIDGDTH